MANIFTDTSPESVSPRHSPNGAGDGLEAVARITNEWDHFGPNGGYLAALLWRAIIGVADADMSPLSFSCQYLAPARPGPATMTVEVVSRTKRTIACQARLMAGEALAVGALARFVRDRDGLEFTDPCVVQPAVPAPERLRPVMEFVPDDFISPFLRNLDLRVVTDEAEWPIRWPVRPYYVAWAKFEPNASHDDPLVDAVRALVLADALIWPAAERACQGRPTHVARSTDLAVSFIDVAAMTPWLLCETTVASARSGVISGSARLWSREGRLVATALSNMYCSVRLEPAP